MICLIHVLDLALEGCIFSRISDVKWSWLRLPLWLGILVGFCENLLGSVHGRPSGGYYG